MQPDTPILPGARAVRGGTRLPIVGLCCAILASVFLPALARGESMEAVVQTFSFSSTDWAETVDLPLFDSSLGDLQAVEFNLTATVGGSMFYESLDSGPQTITMRLRAEITVTPTGDITGVTELVSATPEAVRVETIPGFDGTIDFDGDSGSAFFIPPEEVQTITTYDDTNPLWEISIKDYFTTDTPGETTELAVSAVSTSSGSGASFLATIFQPSAGGELTVTYLYTPIPEPGSLAMLASGLLILCRRQRRQAA